MIRIQKYLSERNILSRRKAEDYIRRGWIYLNGQMVTELGVKIDPVKDDIKISKEGLDARKKCMYIAFNKPKGVLTNCAKHGEREIKDLLPIKYRKLSSIGRLDKDSEGLILFTNDGVFAKALLNHTNPHEREYKVWTRDPFTLQMKEQMQEGIYMLGAKTKSVYINLIHETHFAIVMTEGKNRQIRRMVDTVGGKVVRLKRVRFGSIRLGNLKRGTARALTVNEVNALGRYQ